jgi:hypothetical protein
VRVKSASKSCSEVHRVAHFLIDLKAPRCGVRSVTPTAFQAAGVEERFLTPPLRSLGLERRPQGRDEGEPRREALVIHLLSVIGSRVRRAGFV